METNFDFDMIKKYQKTKNTKFANILFQKHLQFISFLSLKFSKDKKKLEFSILNFFHKFCEEMLNFEVENTKKFKIWLHQFCSDFFSQKNF